MPRRSGGRLISLRRGAAGQKGGCPAEILRGLGETRALLHQVDVTITGLLRIKHFVGEAQYLPECPNVAQCNKML